MKSNLEIYEAVRKVPEEAKKTIRGGRLNGMTDINPMWRIKTLTEMFGVCGFGWKYEIKKEWVEDVGDRRTANVLIDLYIKVDGEWSEPIPGIGGSMLLDQQKSGAYVNDECFKMATTDAISVACKSLGMGADVYFENDSDKYNEIKKTITEVDNTPISQSHAEVLGKMDEQYGIDIASKYGKNSIREMTEGEYGRAMNAIAEARG